MKLIERTYYLQKLFDSVGTPDIKVITGIRRCGKSKLLEAFISKLETRREGINVIHINFNQTEYENLMEYHSLENYVKSRYKDSCDNFLCIDEVQMCQGFEKAINSLYDSGRFDIYITGSNAFLLSSDLATLFTGRTFAIEVYPFSFKEYLQYYGRTDVLDAFDDYAKEGGMAGSFLYGKEEDKYRYIADIFNTLVLRDISSKYKIRNRVLLDNICDFLIDNQSNTTSLRSLSDSISTNKQQTNDRTVGTYVKYLCNAFAFYKVRRYDIRGRKYLASQDKYYLADHSFKYAKLGTRNMDFGRCYENIVAIELLRRGYELYVGALYKKEVDFVAIRQNEKIYIQVCDDISRDETFKREILPLLHIADAYPKIIIARTRHEAYCYEGVWIFDISNWLIK